MKEMKLIMEIFRKNMKEGWPGEPKVEAPWANADKKANAEKMDSWMQQSRDSREKDGILTRAAAQATEDILRDFGGKYSNPAEIVNNPNEEFDTLSLKGYCERALADEIASAQNKNFTNFSESDILAMIDKINAFRDPDEPEEREEKSDMEDPPGYMPGDGADWK